MFAAINELYEPSSSPDDIEAWELVMMVAVCVQSAREYPRVRTLSVLIK